MYTVRSFVVHKKVVYTKYTMSAVSFGSKDKGQDVTTMLAKFEPLNSQQRDDVIKDMPEPQPEELTAEEALLKLSGIAGLSFAYAVNVSTLDTTWVNKFDTFFPPSGFLYMFPAEREAETAVKCIQIPYDFYRFVKSISGHTILLRNKGGYFGEFICPCHNLWNRFPRVWTMRIEGSDMPYDVGVNGMFKVGVPNVEQY